MTACWHLYSWWRKIKGFTPTYLIWRLIKSILGIYYGRGPCGLCNASVFVQNRNFTFSTRYLDDVAEQAHSRRLVYNETRRSCSTRCIFCYWGSAVTLPDSKAGDTYDCRLIIFFQVVNACMLNANVKAERNALHDKLKDGAIIVMFWSWHNALLSCLIT